jgi:hypothetical protein
MGSSLIKFLLAGTLIAFQAAGMARADVILDQTTLIGAPAVAPPSEYPFTATAAEALTVTLTDFQLPAAFTSLQIAVTLGDTLVGSASVDPTTHVATVPIPAAAGDYVLRVIGTPLASQGSGSFGACVTRNSDPTPRTCVPSYSFSGNIQTPSPAASPPSSALDTNFSATVSGVYTVTITDDVFPVALQSVAGGVAHGSTPVNTTGFTFGANQVTLVAGTTYTLILGALADATVKAGLYSVQIADPTGAAVFDRTLPVGTLPTSTIVHNATAQMFGLTLSDYAYPAALAGVGAAVTQGSTSLAKLTAPGALTNLAIPAGSIEIWQYSIAGAQPGVYSLSLSNSTASLYSTTQVVGAGTATTAQSFAFVVTLPAAGTYNLTANDLQLPSALQTLTATFAQNGAALQQTSGGNFTGAQGVAIVVVDAQPPTGGIGLFDVTVAQTGAASPQTLLDQIQAVGGVLNSQTIDVGTSGSYDATLTDLGFPTTFQDLAAVVSSGGTVLGKIYGGGTFHFATTPGPYVVTFVATPGTQNYGLYSLRIASSAPTVTLTASASSVNMGGAVTLKWSSQNATACTASGGTGWTGTQTTSGTLAVSVSAAETLTLTCTGPGGSASQSVAVTVTTAPATSHGGGGSLDLGLLAALGAWVLVRRTGGVRRTDLVGTL